MADWQLESKPLAAVCSVCSEMVFSTLLCLSSQTVVTAPQCSAALALVLASVVSTAIAFAVLLEQHSPFRMFQLTLLVGSDLTIQFGANSGFPGMSCLKSFRFPDGMDPQRVLVPNISSDTKSGRGMFNVDALIVFLMSPDAGFDLAQLERDGLSQHAFDAAGMKLPKVGALYA